jgi:ABC-type Fe3+/spermidine/putrescine transport system ATPase subunit
VTFAIDITATFSAQGAEPFTVEAAFEVERGDTAVVLGPSGSGKSLLLETIAGFHAHDGGVTLDDVELSAKTPEARNFGFVFQDYALFPHMTVAENVRYGGRYRDETSGTETLLADLGIADLTDRYPPTLSGGEKQRVALARALYVNPAVLLLDEPLASLDVPTRTSLRQEMVDVLDGVTAVYVTHDRTTARMVADRIMVMNDGKVIQRGTPADVFERPTSPLVARFTGSNCLPLSADGLREAVGAGPDAEWLSIRPEDVRIDHGTADVTATVDQVLREDAAFRVSLSIDDETIDAFTNDPPSVGSSVGVSLTESARVLF